MTPTAAHLRVRGASVSQPGVAPIRKGFVAAIAALVTFGTLLLMLNWNETRQLGGVPVLVVIFGVLWFALIYRSLQHFGIGVDRVEKAWLGPVASAIVGGAVGAAYCGIPFLLLAIAADSATNGRAAPSEFTKLLRTLSIGVILPGSIVVGALWTGIDARSRSQMRRKRWLLHIVAQANTTDQEQIATRIFSRYAHFIGKRRDLISDGPILLPIDDPDNGEAFLAELWHAGIQGEVVDSDTYYQQHVSAIT